jgi:hypothetical protein
MKLHMEGFEWIVSNKTKEICVVIQSLEECMELIRRAYVLKELYRTQGKKVLLDILKGIGMPSLQSYLIVKWVEKECPMVMEVHQTTRGWLIPWNPVRGINGPMICTLEEAWTLVNPYKSLGVNMRFILMESLEYVW